MSGPSEGDLLATFEAKLASAMQRCNTLELHTIAMEREYRRMCDGLHSLREALAAPGDDA